MEKIHLISSLEMGGAEMYLSELLSLNRKKSEHIFVIKNKIHPIIKSKCEKSKIIINSVFSLFFLKLLFKKSIIYCWMYHAILIGTLFFPKKTICMVRQSRFSKKDKKFTKFIVFHILPSLVKRSLGIVYVSNESRKIHFDYGWSNLRNTIIENGYIFKNGNFPQHIHNISFIGRNHPIKRFDLFYDLSIALNSNYIFQVFGNGYDNYLDSNISVEGICKEDIIYEKTDLVLVLSDDEGFSNVLREAIANNCFVLSTDCGGARDILINDYIINQNISYIIKKIKNINFNIDQHTANFIKIKKKLINKNSISAKYNELKKFTSICVE